MIDLYSDVRLKDGRRATILEYRNDGYLAEVWSSDGELDVIGIDNSDIKSVIQEVEVPVIAV